MTLPFENDTTEVIKHMALHELQGEKRRNIMIILAIVLASFLMSLCGTLFFAFQQFPENLSTFQVNYKNVTQDKIEKLRQKTDIETVGTIYNMSEIKMTKGYTLNLSYMDEEACHIVRNQFVLQSGTMPTKKNEIAVDQEMIETYFPNSVIGDSISLEINGITEEFLISGIVKFPVPSQGIYSCFVSEEFIKRSPDYDPAQFQSYVCFRDANSVSKESLKEKIAAIGKEINAEYNLSFLFFFQDNEGMATKRILSFIGLSILVLFSGATIIQSIFRISINEKIRDLGQLRTLGMTKSQIRRMIKYESVYLSWIGIPPGIILGVITAIIIENNKFTNGFSMYRMLMGVFVVVMICLFMVKFSVWKPSKIATNVPPIQALHYTAYQDISAHSRKVHKKITPCFLAKLSLGRDRKKTISTLRPLIFGGLLLLISASVAVSNTPDQLVREKLFANNGSFRIYLNETGEEQKLKNNPLDYSFKKKLLDIEGVQKVVPLRESIGMCNYIIDGESSGGMCDIISDSSIEGNHDFVTHHLVEGRMPQNTSEILLYDFYLEQGAEIGTPIRLTFNNTEVECVVTGFFDGSTSSVNDMDTIDSANIIITEELARKLCPEIENFSYTWEIVTEKAMNDRIELAIQKESTKKGFSIFSYDDAIKSVSASVNLLFGSLQIFSLLILLFGIINLINMTLSNQQARKYEASILRSVGMSLNQLYKTFVIEGTFYVITSMGIVLLVGVPISIPISKIVGEMFGLETFSYEFPMAQIGIYLLLLIVLQLILSAWTIQNINKKTLVEQLKAIE